MADAFKDGDDGTRVPQNARLYIPKGKSGMEPTYLHPAVSLVEGVLRITDSATGEDVLALPLESVESFEVRELDEVLHLVLVPAEEMRASVKKVLMMA